MLTVTITFIFMCKLCLYVYNMFGCHTVFMYVFCVLSCACSAHDQGRVALPTGLSLIKLNQFFFTLANVCQSLFHFILMALLQ